MKLKEKLGSQLKNHCIHDIIKHFIIGDIIFSNSVYDEPYELLDKCWDNKSGEDKYNTLLSFFIEIRNGQEIELKLYFDERKRYLDAVQFDSIEMPIMSNFGEQLSSVSKRIFVPNVYQTDWECGTIILDNMRCIVFTLNKKSKAYGVLQLENPYVCEQWALRQMGGFTYYNEISFEEFQTSRFWK